MKIKVGSYWRFDLSGTSSKIYKITKTPYVYADNQNWVDFKLAGDNPHNEHGRSITSRFLDSAERLNKLEVLVLFGEASED